MFGITRVSNDPSLTQDTLLRSSLLLNGSEHALNIRQRMTHPQSLHSGWNRSTGSMSSNAKALFTWFSGTRSPYTSQDTLQMCKNNSNEPNEQDHPRTISIEISRQASRRNSCQVRLSRLAQSNSGKTKDIVAEDRRHLIR